MYVGRHVEFEYLMSTWDVRIERAVFLLLSITPRRSRPARSYAHLGVRVDQLLNSNFEQDCYCYAPSATGINVSHRQLVM
jgi:hypothetical protein